MRVCDVWECMCGGVICGGVSVDMQYAEYEIPVGDLE